MRCKDRFCCKDDESEAQRIAPAYTRSAPKIKPLNAISVDIDKVLVN